MLSPTWVQLLCPNLRAQAAMKSQIECKNLDKLFFASGSEFGHVDSFHYMEFNAREVLVTLLQ